MYCAPLKVYIINFISVFALLHVSAPQTAAQIGSI